MFQEFSRRLRSYAKLRNAIEMAHVVRYDTIRSTCHGKFYQHVVFRIREKRSPQKKYPLTMGNVADVVKHIVNFLFRQVDRRQLTFRDTFVLNYQRDGHRDVKSPGSDHAEHFERCSIPRP